MADRNDTAARLQALRKLLSREDSSTQDELRSELEKLDFEVNQSTISRDLRKLGAIKVIDPSGMTVYRLVEEVAPLRQPAGLGSLITDIDHNGAMIVVHSTPGSASLAARVIDQNRMTLGILGTIAGDDTVFVCPRSTRDLDGLVRKVERLLSGAQAD